MDWCAGARSKLPGRSPASSARIVRFAASDCAQCFSTGFRSTRKGEALILQCVVSSPYHAAPAPAVTRTAMHQFHISARVPSPNKCKRCRKVTARRGPKLYHKAFTIGESGGGNEKVFTRKRGVCGDSGTCNGGGHADQHRLLRRWSTMIGPAPISASTPVRPGPRSIKLSPIRCCSAAPDREAGITSRPAPAMASSASTPARNGSGAPGFSAPKLH